VEREEKGGTKKSLGFEGQKKSAKTLTKGRQRSRTKRAQETSGLRITTTGPKRKIRKLKI